MHTSLPGFDHTTDANPVAIRFAESISPLPDYCKELEKTAGYTGAAFADSRNKLFPISSPGHTLMSGIYCLGLPTSPEKAAALTKIEAAVSAWGIQDDWEKYSVAFHTATKEASNEEAAPEFALLVEGGNGVIDGYYPIGTTVELQKSAVDLQYHAGEGRLPAAWISDAARAIKSAAARFGLSDNDLPSFVCAAGRRRELDFDRAASLVQMRKSACLENGNDFGVYEDIIKAAAEAGADALPEFIQLVEDLDLANGVKYGSVQPLPEQIFYCGMTEDEFDKFAQAHVVIADVPVPQTVVGAVKEAAVRQHWTKAKAEQILEGVKAATNCDTAGPATEVFDSLPPELSKEFLIFLHERA